MGSHRHNHKGQSAIEYLTTYGWALLAIGMVIAVLAAWGVFNPCQKVTPSFTGQEVSLDQWAFTDTNSISFTFQAVREDVNITNVSVATVDGTRYTVADSDGTLGVQVNAGQTATVTVDASSPNDLFSSGECASADLHVTYNIVGGIQGIDATASRALAGPVP